MRDFRKSQEQAYRRLVRENSIAREMFGDLGPWRNGGNGGPYIHTPKGDVTFRTPRHPYGSVKQIYVMAMVWTPFLKVGISNNISGRREAFMSPLQIDIRHVRVCDSNQEARDVERLTHELLSDFHHKGEWFSAPVDMAVAAINVAICRYREGAEA